MPAISPSASAAAAACSSVAARAADSAALSRSHRRANSCSAGALPLAEVLTDPAPGRRARKRITRCVNITRLPGRVLRISSRASAWPSSTR